MRQWFLTATLLGAAAASWARPVYAANKIWTIAASGSWTTGGNWSGGVPTASDSATFNKAGEYTVNFSSVFQELNDMFVTGGNADVTFERLVTPATLLVTNASGGRDLTISSAKLNLGRALPVNITVGDDTIVNNFGQLNLSAGSFLNAQELYLDSQGQLNVSSSGDVTSAFGVVGNVQSLDSAYASASVSGTGSTWTNSGELQFGGLGIGFLTISAGGAVSSTTGTIGFAIRSRGAVTVTGFGSTWTNGTLRVGNGGEGSLTISNGGTVSSNTGYVGRSGGSEGDVTVTGSGSSWNIGDSLYVGGNEGFAGGPGTVTILPGGVVSVAADTVLHSGAVVPSGGLLKLEGGTLVTSQLVDRGGVLAWTSGTLHITGSGGLTVVPDGLFASLLLNQNQTLHIDNGLTVAANATLFAGGPLSTGSTTVVEGGKLFVGSAMPNFGVGLVNNGGVVFIDPTTVDGPVVNAATGAITALADVTFSDLVSGSGGFFGAGALTFNGGVSPGASPAEIAFGGNVALADANTLFIEIGGATPGFQFDRLSIAGSASLGGVLDVALTNDFTPVLGDSFEFLKAANGVSGTFADENLPALDFGLGWRIDYRANSIVLEVAAVPAYSADFDEDGDVDADDLVQWQGDFGANGVSDADDDGDSDGADFLAWQRQLGSVPAVAATTVVPEPGTFLLCIVAGAGFCRTARRRRQ